MKVHVNKPMMIGLMYVMTFGKHRGKSIEDIIEIDCGYVVWMYEKEIFRFRKSVRIILDEYEDPNYMWEMEDDPWFWKND